MTEVPAWAQDIVFVETTIDLTWRERLRALVQGRIHCDSRTFIDSRSTRSHTIVATWFEPLPWSRESPMVNITSDQPG